MTPNCAGNSEIIAASYAGAESSILSASGIYEIVNAVNGNRYVGSAKIIANRWREHRKMLNSGSHHSRHLQSSWAKHGADSFYFRVIEICAPDELIRREQAAFDRLTPEYNVCRVAGSTLGRRHSTETRGKIAARAIGRKQPPRSQEHRDALSASSRGRPKGAQHMAALQAGRKSFKIPDEQRLQVSAALRNAYATGLRPREKTKEHCDKISRFFSKLSADQVMEIKRLSAAGISGVELARRFNSQKSTISGIINGTKYKWVPQLGDEGHDN